MKRDVEHFDKIVLKHQNVKKLHGSQNIGNIGIEGRKGGKA